MAKPFPQGKGYDPARMRGVALTDDSAPIVQVRRRIRITGLAHVLDQLRASDSEGFTVKRLGQFARFGPTL